MKISTSSILFLSFIVAPIFAQQDTAWRVHITGDICIDHTWGMDVPVIKDVLNQTTQTYLNQMTLTDTARYENKARYGSTVTTEILYFLEKSPGKKEELYKRLREDRMNISPFPTNTNWGFQSTECLLRSMYPARRIAEESGAPLDAGSHSESPNLPWGAATLLKGSGIKGVIVPYLAFDDSIKFESFTRLFNMVGPDGSKLMVLLQKGYTDNGSRAIDNPSKAIQYWKYLGDKYPARHILVSGTYSDLSTKTPEAVPGKCQWFFSANDKLATDPILINSTPTLFFREIEKTEKEKPFLTDNKGGIGHSWELWTTSLAKYAGFMRQGDRELTVADALIAASLKSDPSTLNKIEADRLKAEWMLCLLSDHAWNGGTLNYQLRKRWSDTLLQKTVQLKNAGWQLAGHSATTSSISLFNPLSFGRKDLVSISLPDNGPYIVKKGNREIPSQIIQENNINKIYFISDEIGAFCFDTYTLSKETPTIQQNPQLTASSTNIESPFYKLAINTSNGSISSCIHKASNKELTSSNGIGQITWNGELMNSVTTKVIASGPVLARIEISGKVGPFTVKYYISSYASLDRIDFDMNFDGAVNTNHVLNHGFSILDNSADLKIETVGAIERPFKAPKGDVLPGGMDSKFVVQGFADVANSVGFGATIVPVEAFTLRPGAANWITFEAMSNSNNQAEVPNNQNNETSFKYRYSLQGYNFREANVRNAKAVLFSRSVQFPIEAVLGTVTVPLQKPLLSVDSTRAIVSGLKIADGLKNGKLSTIVRFWEIGGQNTALKVQSLPFGKAVKTDLIERDKADLAINSGTISTELAAQGFIAVRLYKEPTNVNMKAKKLKVQHNKAKRSFLLSGRKTSDIEKISKGKKNNFLNINKIIEP